MPTDIFEKHNINLPSIDEADAKDNPPIVVKFTNGQWNWYIIGGDKLDNGDYLLYGLVDGMENDNGDYLLYGLVDGMEKELGKFTLKEIETVSATLTPDFDSIGLYDLKSQL